MIQGEGVKMPGSGITISKTAVRGVDSFGMLCSAHDIGWSNEADGVLVIMPDDAQPGDPCPAEAPKVTLQNLLAVMQHVRLYCSMTSCVWVLMLSPSCWKSCNSMVLE